MSTDVDSAAVVTEPRGGELAYRVRVEKVWSEALDILSFKLASADGRRLPAFSAGSHVDVVLPGGFTRQYSLCNDPGEDGYVIAVLKTPHSRGGSRAMHELREGDLLTISSPKNHFPLAHEAKRSLLLAGGIGVTPLICMAERLAATGADFQMHYCTRSLKNTAFHSRIRKSGFSASVEFHFDDALEEPGFDLASCLERPEAGTHLYVCGPQGFMDAALKEARAAGWPEGQLHYEFFGAKASGSDTDRVFDVHLASSGKIVRVNKGQSIVEALAIAGVVVPTSCEQGVCGTCLTRVLEGTPDHRDMYLTDEEHTQNDQMTVCCSRALTPALTLDI